MLKILIPFDVQKILSLLQSNGYDGYVVGGCVRDSILGLKPNDWDICTDCVPEKMLDIFSSFKVIPTGLKHGTITVVINNENYEITTYRVDGKYTNGRHPTEVMFTDELKEDLQRRDFVINAMAYNDKVGLVDHYGGLQDILNKRIMCVGNPFERFTEDYLRMLRGVRFATQLGYNIELTTFNAIKELSRNIVNISAERTREELNKILLSDVPSNGLKLLNNTGLLKYIIPELERCVGFNQYNPYHKKNVFDHILDVVDNTDNDLILRLAALFHDIGKPYTFSLDKNGVGHFYGHDIKSAEITKKIMKRLRYDNDSIEQTVVLVREHMLKNNNLSDKSLKKLINRVGKNNIDRLFKLQIADIGNVIENDNLNIKNILLIKRRIDKILNEKQPLSVKDLEINGYDLMELGISEGKKIGIILKNLLNLVLEDSENNKKELLIHFALKCKECLSCKLM